MHIDIVVQLLLQSRKVCSKLYFELLNKLLLLMPIKTSQTAKLSGCKFNVLYYDLHIHLTSIPFLTFTTELIAK